MYDDDISENETFLCAYILDAARRAGLKADWAMEYGFLGRAVKVTDPSGKEHIFEDGRTPFNSPEAEKLMNNKVDLLRATEADILSPAFVHFDKRKTSFEDIAAAAEAMIADPGNPIKYPCIIKPDEGTLSRGVFVVRNGEELRQALRANMPLKDTFNTHDNGHRIILQQGIVGTPETQHAYTDIRAMCFDGTCQFAFTRDRLSVVEGRISSDELKPEFITDPDILDQLSDIAEYLNDEHGIRYAGLDLRTDETGNLWLLEANSSPLSMRKIYAARPQAVMALASAMVQTLIKKSTPSATPREAALSAA